MPNSYFQFKQFTVSQEKCGMKVTTDGCLFGAWIAEELKGEKPNPKNILDIGTGTGLLSLMVAQKNPDIIIDAIEIDKESSEQAKENIIASPFREQVNIIQADARQFEPTQKYDLIISNPPFYENELKSTDKKRNTAHHSHDLPLAELFIVTKKLLADNGRCYFLLPYKRKNELGKELNKYSLHIQKIISVKQLIQHDFFRLMICCSAEKKQMMKTEQINICNDKQEYTEEFTKLLKDYYLYL